MTDWQAHWEQHAARAEDFFQQVGRTVGGQAVAAVELEHIERAVLAALQPTPDDALLDLCCGNGQLTRRLATHCRTVAALDFSAPLIETARRHFAAPHIQYRQGSALALPDDLLPPGQKFDRVCMSDALQYFQPEQVAGLLNRLKSLCRPGWRFFCGGVPDVARLGSFYNTPERRADYQQRLARDGHDALGRWYERAELQALAQAAGCDCQTMDQAQPRYTAHYRFDALISSRA